MALVTTLKDGSGSNSRVRVGMEGEVSTICHPRPPFGNYKAGEPVRLYFTDTNDSSEMVVDGSISPVEFFIESEADSDIYIKSISLMIADQGASLNRFGNITALDKGVTFKYTSPLTGETILHEGLKTSFDILRLSTLHTGTGSNASSLRLSNAVGSNAEVYISFIDLTALFGLPWGIRLKAGSNEKISFTVQDNITALSAFNGIAFGTRFKTYKTRKP